MPICEERKLAFCHVPRTGGNAIINGLNLKVVEKHEPASWYRKKYPDFFLFATVRPYKQRLLSGLNHDLSNLKKHSKKEFETIDDFVAYYSNKCRPKKVPLVFKPLDYFLDAPVDFLIRYHFLEEDLNKMLSENELSSVSLKKTDCLFPDRVY